MADAFEKTEKKRQQIEKKLTQIYTKSQKDVTKAWKAYMKDIDKEIKPLQEAYEKAKAEGSDDVKTLGKKLGRLKRDKTIRNDYYKGMIDKTTKELASVNQTALAFVNDQMPWVYSVNYNDFAQTGINMGLAFNLVDESVVRRMVMDGDIKLPKKKIDIPKDQRWNTKKLNSSVLQGIVNGESIPKIAERIKPVIGENESACIRNARTMVTGAENAGKNDSYKRAEDMGIELVEVWKATPDGRTRPTHIALDGEEKKVGDTFSNGLEYPGDPSGDPSEVYNCRCRMIAHIVGFKYNMNDKSQRWSRIGDESIEDWRQSGIDYTSMIRKSAPTAIVRHYVAEGSDISSVWKRRADQFDFEIEDVINAQGFDGLPRVVSADEFDEYVKESNIIMQRGYTAPDQETLKAYQNELYNGKWYVDCSSGGHMYGRGMYADGRFGTSVNESMTSVMQGYGGVNPNGKVETFTLTSDAKILDYKDVDRLRQEYGRDAISKIVGLEKESKEERLFAYSQMGMTNTEETIKAMNWASENSNKIQDIYTKYISPYSKEIGEIRNKAFSMDEGVLASLKGYDAINCESIVKGDSDGYFVILNRTKCIFKGE